LRVVHIWSVFKEKTVLPQVVTILLDKCDELNEEDYNKVKEAINAVSISAAGE
jgi:hypothetical protein